MKLWRPSVVLIAFALASGSDVLPAGADTLTTSSVVITVPVGPPPGGAEVPLELRIETDRPFYNPGETAHILFTVTSFGSEGIWISTLHDPPLNVRVKEGKETLWYAFSATPPDQWPPPGPGVSIGGGGQASVECDWDLVDEAGQPVRPGPYSVEGRLGWGTIPVLDAQGNVIDSIESGWGVAVDIAVLPEPSALAILSLGLVAWLGARSSAYRWQR